MEAGVAHRCFWWSPLETPTLRAQKCLKGTTFAVKVGESFTGIDISVLDSLRRIAVVIAQRTTTREREYRRPKRPQTGPRPRASAPCCSSVTRVFAHAAPSGHAPRLMLELPPPPHGVGTDLEVVVAPEKGRARGSLSPLTFGPEPLQLQQSGCLSSPTLTVPKDARRTSTYRRFRQTKITHTKKTRTRPLKQYADGNKPDPIGRTASPVRPGL